MIIKKFESLDDALSKITAQMERNEDVIDLINDALEVFPEQEFLHFLLASQYAEKENNMEAIKHFIKAIELKQDFHIARYQLLFLSVITESYDIFEKYSSVMFNLADDHYLNLLTKGFYFLIQNDEVRALDYFTEGLKRNTENPAVNFDIEKVISILSDNEPPINAEKEINDFEVEANSALLDIYNNQS